MTPSAAPSGWESVDLGRTVAEAEAMSAVPEPVARRFLAVGLTLERGADNAPRRLTVAMADPFDVIALDHLRSLFDGEVEIVAFLAGRSDIKRFLERAYRHDLTVAGILHEIETGVADPGGLPANADEYSQPIVRLVDMLLSDAVKREASDIHFEPEAGFLRVRYRIDGVLRQVRSLHRGYWSAIAVRLKVMCGMNIAETRAPQDGRMTLSVSGHDIDYRVSALPTTHGENIVLRVLDRGRGIVALDALGMSSHALAELRRMMERPEGVILVTGPTGSGKTTTLYSILAHLDREAINIMTLEDPVEYPMTPDPPDVGERGRQARLRQRRAEPHAAGPGHHPGRRDPRCGHRRDDLPGRDDRPPGLLHPAHELPPSARSRGSSTSGLLPACWPGTSSGSSPSGSCDGSARNAGSP